MDRALLERELGGVIAGRRLLDHPFYQRWERGELEAAELAAYAAQYRHLEAALPELLGGVAAGMDPGPGRDAVLRTLADEVGPPTHLELFDGFAVAVGADFAPPTPATAALLELQRRQVAEGAATGLAALLAYELQVPEVAASKAEGLRAHHGLDAGDTRFWDLHAGLDVEHAAWSLDALAALDADPARVVDSARQVAGGWWAFLDEREAVTPGG
ncbi:MAG TPA: iron-containing redox enzyme family protein [Candidatus Dormibacteraeota bacterium]